MGAVFKRMRKKNSIVFKLSVIIAAVLVAVSLLLVSYNVYSFCVGAQNLEEQQRRVMAMHAQQLNAVFTSATTTLNELALDNLGKLEALQDASAFRRYSACAGLGELLAVKVDSNPRLACLYVVSGGGDVFLSRYSAAVDWRRKISLEDALRHGGGWENDAISGAWHVQQLADGCFLRQNYRIGPADIGVLISLEQALENLQRAQGARSVYFFTDENGVTLASEDPARFPVGAQSGGGQPFAAARGASDVLFTQALEAGGIRLACAIPKRDMYAGMQLMQYLLGGLGAAVVVVVAVLSRYLNRHIAVPVQKLAVATQEIERGNIDYQIAENGAYAREFSDLIVLFNNMSREIKELKIQNYEETLERKNAELKYLQMQLRPHFYLNAMTTISSLSMRGENAQIQKFIEALSTYLRYLFTDAPGGATVGSEIRHAVDFIRLQQIRHADRIFYYQCVEPAVAQVPVQKLLVQTFVENIFKHAFDGEEPISIFLHARRVRRDGEDFAQLTVEDTGCGFPPELLAERMDQKAARGVGIGNVYKTLAFAYGRNDLLKLSNNEQGGAQVDIFLPLEEERGPKA